MLVLPSWVAAVKVAYPPASFTLVKISSSPLNSSPILCQESELNVGRRSLVLRSSLYGGLSQNASPSLVNH